MTRFRSVRWRESKHFWRRPTATPSVPQAQSNSSFPIAILSIDAAEALGFSSAMSSVHVVQINGQSRRLTVDHYDTPLLYALRGELGLKSARFGCGSGDCGACTVLVDGRALRSCELPVWSVEGKSVTTIEGLTGSATLARLRRAFLDNQAGQCGYCLCGIIMSAIELIDAGGEPSRAKIALALERNLCRCGAHNRIMNAIETAWRESREEPR
jgi:nicotinate dehydrogenase subunit A